MNLLSIVRPYAKAAFEYAAEKNTIAAWHEILQLAANVIKQAEVKQLFYDPSISEKELWEIFVKILAIKDKSISNFFRLLIDYHRLPVIPFILSEFIKHKENYDKALKVEIISALELTAAQQQKITKALEKRYQKNILLSHKIDQTLLGGAIIKSDDLVIDGSIFGRLSKLREYLKGDQQL